jgi:peroxiredoxin (alkyl hydroperoxide reductase subunit C)
MFADQIRGWSYDSATDTAVSGLADHLGIITSQGVALRATFIVDPENIIQHVTVNNLDVGRNPEETLRVLDALQTGELCACNRAVGGETL